MSKIYLVMLRQPKMKCLTEKRSDPFWEFGSFGLTGCHGSNLLHPRNHRDLQGSKLAFAQGGKKAIKLVALTAPITVEQYPYGCEARWNDKIMPFQFDCAPVLVDNFGGGGPRMISYLRQSARSTPCGAFASSFRSRARPLEDELAQEIEYLVSLPLPRADEYWEAMPHPPPDCDRMRERTYSMLQSIAQIGKSIA